MAAIPSIRNARIYWRPNRGRSDPGGFYPVCLDPACNGLSAWAAEEPGHKTGDEAAHWLLTHRKQRHNPNDPSASEEALKEAGSFAKLPRLYYNPADTDPGAP